MVEHTKAEDHVNDREIPFLPLNADQRHQAADCVLAPRVLALLRRVCELASHWQGGRIEFHGAL